MNIVGLKTDGKIFESQAINSDDAELKVKIKDNIQNDATAAGIEITISEMTDEELQAAISI